MHQKHKQEIEESYQPSQPIPIDQQPSRAKKGNRHCQCNKQEVHLLFNVLNISGQMLIDSTQIVLFREC